MTTNYCIAMEDKYKYFAFISYNHQDAKEAYRLQKKLEHYSLPTTTMRMYSLEKNPMKPVFFAETDIQPGNLNDELQQRLSSSRYLIVVCSPASAQSMWVGKEILYYIEAGRKDQILLFVVDGIPGSGDPATECFNPVIKEHLSMAYLGANIHEEVASLPKALWRERAYTQIVSKMLGLEFDDLWQRYRRNLKCRKAVRMGTMAIAVLMVIGAGVLASRPTAMTLEVTDLPPINANLYADEGVVTFTLSETVYADTIHGLPATLTFNNIPRKYAGDKVVLHYEQPGFEVLDTTVTMQREVSLVVKRQIGYYGHVVGYTRQSGTDHMVAHVKIRVGEVETVSDEQGYFELNIPLEYQTSDIVKAYQGTAELAGRVFPTGALYPERDAPGEVVNYIEVE